MVKGADRLKVLLLEPYYGGSHRRFLEGLVRETPFEFTLMEMPARKWKWRMRLSAPEMARLIKESGRRYDRVLCSTFVDVATLRALGPPWLMDVPVLTYFHENQFAYPVQRDDGRDMHFALTNMTTAMASDSIAFNSAYNRETFVEGVRQLLKKSPDTKPADPTGEIMKKSRVISPALDFVDIDNAPEAGQGNTPAIIWNHRWEHDKGPEDFFHALYTLDRQGMDFSLIVLGQSFERQPEVFAQAKERLASRIIHFGYAGDRDEYARLLRQGTIAVSTSTHEFFGMSVIEAVRAGCRPLLPRRLSYPALFPDEFLYSEGQLTARLKDELARNARLDPEQSLALTVPHSWQECRQKYIDWITEAGRR